jgi:hypothetical protein
MWEIIVQELQGIGMLIMYGKDGMELIGKM